ncbi:MAG: YbaB/EbfC family nucleoid-associated protein [Erysipelotrichaceae bacterium]
MNMQALLKQAQKMQKEVVETENELKSHIYTAEVSSGAIQAEATGELKVSKIMIQDEDLLKVENKEMFNVFNMGIGFVLAVDSKEAQKTIEALAQINEKAYVIGEVTSSGSVDLKW